MVADRTRLALAPARLGAVEESGRAAAVGVAAPPLIYGAEAVQGYMSHAGPLTGNAGERFSRLRVEHRRRFFVENYVSWPAASVLGIWRQRSRIPVVIMEVDSKAAILPAL